MDGQENLKTVSAFRFEIPCKTGGKVLEEVLVGFF
jgi:hypothetical protein